MSAKTTIGLILFLPIGLCVLNASAQTADNWIGPGGSGGNGNWSTTADWSAGVPNNMGANQFNVTISNGGVNETITLDLSPTINNLTLGSGATLQSSGSNSLTIAAGGSLTNAGTINFSTAGSALTVNGNLSNNSGQINVQGGTTLSVSGSVNNSGTLTTGFSGGGNTVNVGGLFTNASGANLNLEGSGDVVNLNGGLSDSGNIAITNTGATLNWTGGGQGITDVIAGTTLVQGGTFNVINGGVKANALAHLTSIEGTLDLENGQTTTATPNGGTLTVSSTGTLSVQTTAGTTLSLAGNLSNSGQVNVEGGTILSVSGSVNNSGTLTTGFSGGGNTVNVAGLFTNASGANLNLESSGDVVNLNGGLSDSGNIAITNTGATLNWTGGGQGITDVIAGTTLVQGGTFNVINGGVKTNALAHLTSIEGTLDLENGQTMTATPNGGTLTVSSTGTLSVQTTAGTTLSLAGNLSNSGQVNVEGGTTLSVSGSVNNSGTLTTGFSGGGNTVNVAGLFTNASGANLNLESSGDVVNLNGGLSDSGNIAITNTGATLNWTGGGQGITDVIASTTLVQGGTFNVINGGVKTNALAHLTSIEGTLDLENGQTMTATPNGGTLTVSSAGTLSVQTTAGTTLSLAGNLSNSGQVNVEGGTILSVSGSVNNSGTLTTGFSGGGNTVNVSGLFTNASGANLNLESSGDVVNLNGGLSDSGNIAITNTGATLNWIGGGQGITDVIAGSKLVQGGTFNVINGGVTSNALAHLTSIEGTLNLQNAQTTAATPNGGTLTISSTGQVNVQGGTTLSVSGNVNNSGAFATGFSGGVNTVNVSGLFTNASGANLTLFSSGDMVNVNTLSNAGTVTIDNGASLVLGGTAAGTLTNSNAINIAGGTLKFNNSALTLGGSGTVTMSAGSGTTSPVIEGATGTDTLTNVNNIIQGMGNIGNNQMALNNQKIIDANNPSAPLIIQTSNGTTNSGTLEATGGGTLQLDGNTFTNTTKGIITASGTNSIVALENGATVSGGKLSTSTGGLIETASGQTATLKNLSLAGSYTGTDSSTTILQGTITNTGTLTLSSSGHATNLELSGNVTLAGTGKVVLSNNANNFISPVSGNPTLTNANIIEGSGTIENIGVTNTGTILANQSTPLIIAPSAAGLNNQGTLSVSSGDLLQISSANGGSLTNFSGNTLTGGTYSVAGTLQFGAAGTSLVTNAGNITLTGAGAQIVDSGNGNILANFATNNGSFALSSHNFTTVGNFTNNGTLTVGTASKFIVNGNLLNFSANTLNSGTYNVTGTLQFNNAAITTNDANITLSAATSKIVNQGGVDALTGLSTNNGSFTVTSGRNFNTAGNFTNNGTLGVGSKSAFVVTGNLTNFSGTTLNSGTYQVTGTLQFMGANIVDNAANITLTGATSKIVDQNGNNALANFATNTGNFTINGGHTFTSVGAFSNNGSIVIGAGSTFTVPGSFSYTQGGGQTLDDGTLTASTVSLNAGDLSGKGTINGAITVSNSVVAPGDSPTVTGILTDKGAYTQNASGTLDIAIGGLTAGKQYDQLNPTTAALGGTLNISLINGFVPKVGSTFKIMNYTSETGNFATINGLAINSTEHFAETVQGTDLLLTVVAGPSPLVTTGRSFAVPNAANFARLCSCALDGMREGALSRPVSSSFVPPAVHPIWNPAIGNLAVATQPVARALQPIAAANSMRVAPLEQQFARPTFVNQSVGRPSLAAAGVTNLMLQASAINADAPSASISLGNGSARANPSRALAVSPLRPGYPNTLWNPPATTRPVVRTSHPVAVANGISFPVLEKQVARPTFVNQSFARPSLAAADVVNLMLRANAIKTDAPSASLSLGDGFRRAKSIRALAVSSLRSGYPTGQPGFITGTLRPNSLMNLAPRTVASHPTLGSAFRRRGVVGAISLPMGRVLGKPGFSMAVQ